MVILSVHASSSSLYSITAAQPWISSSSLSIACSCSTLKQSGGVRSLRSSAVFCDAKAVVMAEMVEEKEKKKESAAGAATAVSASASYELRSFLDARSDLLSVVQREAEDGKLPQNVAQGMLELYENYRNAVLKTKDPKADEIVLSNMVVAFDRIFLDVKDPFEFSPHHRAIREPFDYYVFGQNYIRPLIDFRNSYVGNISLFTEIEETVQKGENVILISNHQTEADPAVIALLLDSTHPYLAENMIYVAGDRVITDPLCKPFSIGRNLLCVYSKKHMGDVPELIEMKKKANTRSLKEMAVLLRGGSKIIWIAPSGGRDRPDPVTQEWSPAPFDPSSVDNMRRLVEHAAVPGHIYPLAVLCNDIMPPPPQVEKEIGEKRVMSFHGVGLSVAPNINFHEVADSIKDHEEAKNAYSKALFNSVNQQYKVLTSAIHGEQGLKASTTTVSLSQPWQ
ncbi:glycerol-3-phosphate acyltransferase ATS12, chloroplastic-like isoform X2 [Ipomoea triloba]|uniref:glycerol-3-phosphate acyltransferase ATS12, chloroplastic-like isoform X2 n=1 Tax=Ipomoea triloba TaxID=35885 RepID=UPI00125E944B|nr:glycerol-3-phosphate acyltransferase ATS12, chloroplastic-like isoform X2 [Ipomoea triloba]